MFTKFSPTSIFRRFCEMFTTGPSATIRFRALNTERTTMDPKEIKHFGEMSKEWWEVNGPARGLHSMNSLRVPWIQNCLKQCGMLKASIDDDSPLQGLSVLDVGCGGGILTEPLSRLGCDTTGLDANSQLIEVAKLHAEQEKLFNVQYVCETILEHSVENKEKYDVVVCSETIEHVTDQEDFLKASIKCLKPGGSIFITTQNKTWLTKLLVIYIMENVLFYIPKGTHEYDKFMKLQDLLDLLENENCHTIVKDGVMYNPLTDKWRITTYTTVSFALQAVKN